MFVLCKFPMKKMSLRKGKSLFQCYPIDKGRIWNSKTVIVLSAFKILVHMTADSLDSMYLWLHCQLSFLATFMMMERRK